MPSGLAQILMEEAESLVVPLVSHVSEWSTICAVFALSRRDDYVAQRSTRLAKEGKARARRNLGFRHSDVKLTLHTNAVCRDHMVAAGKS
jgi:hypothetical protein